MEIGKPIHQNVGYLAISPMGRWVLNDHELTSGTGLQVLVGPYWIDVSIEHNGSEYYAIPLAVRLHTGLKARI